MENSFCRFSSGVTDQHGQTLLHGFFVDWNMASEASLNTKGLTPHRVIENAIVASGGKKGGFFTLILPPINELDVQLELDDFPAELRQKWVYRKTLQHLKKNAELVERRISEEVGMETIKEDKNNEEESADENCTPHKLCEDNKEMESGDESGDIVTYCDAKEMVEDDSEDIAKESESEDDSNKMEPEDTDGGETNDEEPEDTDGGETNDEDEPTLLLCCSTNLVYLDKNSMLVNPNIPVPDWFRCLNYNLTDSNKDFRVLPILRQATENDTVYGAIQCSIDEFEKFKELHRYGTHMKHKQPMLWNMTCNYSMELLRVDGTRRVFEIMMFKKRTLAGVLVSGMNLKDMYEVTSRLDITLV